MRSGMGASPAGDVQKVLNKQAFWAGRSEVALMLHHPGAYPSGAIAPMCLLCTPAEPHPQGVLARLLLVPVAATASKHAFLRAITGLRQICGIWPSRTGFFCPIRMTARSGQRCL